MCNGRIYLVEHNKINPKMQQKHVNMFKVVMQICNFKMLIAHKNVCRPKAKSNLHFF